MKKFFLRFAKIRMHYNYNYELSKIKVIIVNSIEQEKNRNCIMAYLDDSEVDNQKARK